MPPKGPSPFDHLILGHRQRSDILHPLRAGVDTPQSLEDLILELGNPCGDIADWYGKTSFLKRVWQSKTDVMLRSTHASWMRKHT